MSALPVEVLPRALQHMPPDFIKSYPLVEHRIAVKDLLTVLENVERGLSREYGPVALQTLNDRIMIVFSVGRVALVATPCNLLGSLWDVRMHVDQLRLAGYKQHCAKYNKN